MTGTHLPPPDRPPTDPGGWPVHYAGPTLEQRDIPDGSGRPGATSVEPVWLWRDGRWLEAQLDGWWRDQFGWWGHLHSNSGGPSGMVPAWQVALLIRYDDEG